MMFRMLAALLCVFAVLSALVTTRTQGAQDEQLGEVHFAISCSPAAQVQFDRAVALLHSFFYPETVRAFTEIGEAEPTCGMAYWGIAMSIRQNPLVPPDADALEPGRVAIERAKEAGAQTQRERDWIVALDSYYRDLRTVPHATRVLIYERAMEELYRKYPEDREAAVFYALAINEAVDYTDKTYERQLRAGAILEAVFARQPNHPGVAHYIIHSYDYAPLAERAVPAARHYAAVAPSAPHALHMPSHIFSILGLWEEVIDSNLASEAASRAYAAFNQSPRQIPLHSYDFRVHAHLQLAQDQTAREIVDERNMVEQLNPVRLTNDMAFAAIPVRYALERGQWREAAALEPRALNFPQSRAVIHFGRALGAARNGDPASARAEVQQLEALRDMLLEARDVYWAEQVEVQRLAAAAWVAHAEGDETYAIVLMRQAADLEDASEKHIAMENRLFPMRELLGSLLLEANQPREALAELEASLRIVPNRFHAFSGAARAAEMVGDWETAATFYSHLVALTANGDTERPEVRRAREFLAAQERAVAGSGL
jgi:hypothetical protein